MNEKEFEHIMFQITDIKSVLNYHVAHQNRVLLLAKAILEQYELVANSGNELIFKEYSELKELVLKLDDMDKYNGRK